MRRSLDEAPVAPIIINITAPRNGTGERRERGSRLQYSTMENGGPFWDPAAMTLSRPIDQFYKVFFALMIPITYLADLQVFYPDWMLPEFMKAGVTFYLDLTADPLVGDTMGNWSQNAWFYSFQWLELLIQGPMYFIGLYALLKGYRSVYILILIYGVMTFTTTLPCLITFLAPSTEGRVLIGDAMLTESQRWILVASYGPFVLIPLVMMADCSLMLIQMVKIAERAVKATKAKAR